MGNAFCTPQTEFDQREEDFFDNLPTNTVYCHYNKRGVFPLTQMVKSSLKRSDSETSGHSNASTSASPTKKASRLMRHFPELTTRAMKPRLCPIEETAHEKSEVTSGLDELDFDRTESLDWFDQSETLFVLPEDKEFEESEENQKDIGRQNFSPENFGEMVQIGEDIVEKKQIRVQKTGFS